MDYNTAQKIYDMVLELKVLVQEGWYQMICQTDYNGKLIRAFDAAQQMLEDLDRFMDIQNVPEPKPSRGEVILEKEQKYRDLLSDKSDYLQKFFIRKDLVEELVNIHLLLDLLTKWGWDEPHKNEEKDILEKTCREKVDFALDRFDNIIRKIHPRILYVHPEFIRYFYQWLSRITSKSEKYKDLSKSFGESAERHYQSHVEHAEEHERDCDERDEKDEKAGKRKPLFPTSIWMEKLE